VTEEGEGVELEALERVSGARAFCRNPERSRGTNLLETPSKRHLPREKFVVNDAIAHSVNKI